MPLAVSKLQLKPQVMIFHHIKTAVDIVPSKIQRLLFNNRTTVSTCTWPFANTPIMQSTSAVSDDFKKITSNSLYIGKTLSLKWVGFLTK